MNYKDIIRDKRNGNELTKEQVFAVVEGVTQKQIPDYQLSAFLMAVYFKGMTIKERGYLTQAMASSGKTMDFSHIPGKKVDKHSTGGVGDKTSIILVPLMMELGIKSPMVTGRGLGHTGGTTDKLESIPNFVQELTFEKMAECMKNLGTFMATQTADIAPADKVIYGMRDSTETVEEISLITASILSKKFSENLDALVMDVKCGPSAFMHTIEKATELADSIKKTCEVTGVLCKACITRMDFPLGEHIGNANEIYECIQSFDPTSKYGDSARRLQFDKGVKGLVKFQDGLQSGVDLLILITFVLALQIVIVSGKEQDEEKAFKLVKDGFLSGNLMKHFRNLCKEQTGDLDSFLKHYQTIQEHLDKNEQSEKVIVFRASEDFKIKKLDGVKLGNIMVDLNAGRKVFGEKINHDVSIQWYAYPNQLIRKNDIICKVYHPLFTQHNEGGKIYTTYKSDKHFSTHIIERLQGCLDITYDLNYQYQEPFIYDVL
ncbi:pyrimidine-nucleoside phosphorylase, putative [Ichthyophthirius multifiliis]|uniref:Thymidine phosphorylase n=1 Tax=Ichthyophthirius multifiliis TaxID=5932 RepID=G0QLL1_ICHMU|nr:pyrimidine-nucleoside phosphorylase, putative [Ichthyophthirius multifiliis]EGR33895.1 pyrimidine-nucleoside phosphorylase, putative [Ichthyophthirius multifiliis]|eukprot:XP_004039119.1 pyrimidine-nucleoside phosphorylase, putative [Ichthyophthirius multifiliis]